MSTLKVAGLFAGVGGIELGLERAGLESVFLSEIDPAASSVLSRRFPNVRLEEDVRDVTLLPSVDVLAAGFPCTDISQAGRKAGIDGAQSGLVSNIFRLLDASSRMPEYILIENVSYLLRLQQGRGLYTVLNAIRERGYRWAYRVVDARSFGLPQRRQRVIILASIHHDPAPILFNDDAFKDYAQYDKIGRVENRSLYGFYWTEGKRGLGWTRDAVPTIKGGSGLGIPSAPAIWDPRTGRFGTPTISDGEALQGFPRGWTSTEGDAPSSRSEGARWKQVGNAVSVPMSEWVGKRIVAGPTEANYAFRRELASGDKWPTAATMCKNRLMEVDVSMSPLSNEYSLSSTLAEPLKPLSARASRGFLSRANESKLRFPNGFLTSLSNYIDRI